MREKSKIRACKPNHKGPFSRLNGSFVKCETCDGILGSELVETKKE